MTEADTDPTASTGPPAGPSPQTPPPWWPPVPPKKGRVKKILIYFGVLILILAVGIYSYVGGRLAALSEGDRMSQHVLVPGPEDQVVAVYAVDGIIDGSAAENFGVFFRQVRDTPEIKAVVIRVDSPGGTVTDSDGINMMIQKIREELKRPVVVSMGGYAASGGYYISAPADTIYAEPTTITASIGVIMQIPVAAGWLKEHGLKMVLIRSSQAQRYKMAINPYEDPDPEILRKQQKLLDAIHVKFVAAVKKGRGSKVRTKKIEVTVKNFEGKDETLEQTYPFNGQIMMGDEAQKIGLVDEIGYLDDAVGAAVKLAKLDKPRIVQYAKSRGLLNRLLFASEAEIPTVGIDTKMLEQYFISKPMMIWRGQ